MPRLANKTAVVLGASASGGTGWAISEALAAEGARVMVAARTLVPLLRLADKIGGIAVQCDAGKPTDIANLASQASQAFGKIDVAVNAAGMPMMATITDVTDAQLQSALDVNYLGNVHFVKHMAAIMNGGGSITLITSYAAVQPLLPHFAYGCAKAATDCLVRYAAAEYGPQGVRVNSIQPGPIKSDLSAGLFAIPGVEEVFNKEVPLGRVGLPADYADAVLWLAGPAFISGAQLPINGGIHLARSPRSDELPIPPEYYTDIAGGAKRPS